MSQCKMASPLRRVFTLLIFLAPLRGFGGLFAARGPASQAASDVRVQAAIDEAPLIVFGTDSCPFCHRVRVELRQAGFEATFHILSGIERTSRTRGRNRNVEPRATTLTCRHRCSLPVRELTGQRTIPYVFVRGKFVGGCNDGPEEWMGALKLLRVRAIDPLNPRR